MIGLVKWKRPLWSPRSARLSRKLRKNNSCNGSKIASETHFRTQSQQNKSKRNGNFVFQNHQQNTLWWVSRKSITSRLSTTPGRETRIAGPSTKNNFFSNMCSSTPPINFIFQTFQRGFLTSCTGRQKLLNLWGSGSEAPGKIFYYKKLLNGPWKPPFLLRGGGKTNLTNMVSEIICICFKTLKA